MKPNPANSYIKVKVICRENEMYNAKITNAMGQKILETTLQCNKENVIRTTNFQQGFYTVTVKTNTKVHSFKLSIIR